MNTIKVIGIGGIGTALLPFLCRYLNFPAEGGSASGGEKQGCRVTLIDGDEFELKNAKRQAFKEMGKKAKVKAHELAQEFENISFRAKTEYVDEENISEYINDGDMVFLSVDNHKTRKIVSEYCETLNDVILISGGNELTDGNVQIYIRKNKKDSTASLTKYHPEIKHPVDKNPAEMSCGERASLPESRQLLFTNMGVAWLMCIALWLIDQEQFDKCGEFYFDINEGKVVNMKRLP
ncbi:MAG: ThiF family adenylyltransferase [Parcubacteria group bacterium]|nr:ThiF family adenylyltransferase [Parcubacteria group bacterium]